MIKLVIATVLIASSTSIVAANSEATCLSHVNIKETNETTKTRVLTFNEMSSTVQAPDEFDKQVKSEKPTTSFNPQTWNIIIEKSKNKKDS